MAEGNIIFRQIVQPRPGDWTAGLHWYVEFHDAEHDMAFPSGIAFVSAHNNMKLTLGCSAMLDFIFVVDQNRREGVATKLIEACRERWADINLGEAISPSGEKFLKSLETAGLAP